MMTSIVASLGLLAVPPGTDAKAPRLPDMDRIRIAEAFRLAEVLGNRVWPDWDRAPFAILLVTPEHEFLIGHPAPSPDFAPIGEDPLLRRKVWYRKRVYPTHFEATFPAVGGVSTIVIGRAENTASKDSTRRVITLLHEHFHQLQESRPGFQARVDALGLARGDRTGMWMLNYPFPYSDPEVKDRFTRMERALAAELRLGQQADFADKLASYVEARRKFRSLLKADDDRYFAFQVWKEGIARYTECRLAELAAADYSPSEEFRALKDYRPFKEVGRAIRDSLDEELGSVQLDRAKRNVVYAFGAAEGLLLDRAHPDWRRRYLEGGFSLDRFFDVNH